MRSTDPLPPLLVDLIYELLDAHNDTAALLAAVAREPAHDAHVDYLRALQRRARAILAEAVATPGAVRSE